MLAKLYSNRAVFIAVLACVGAFLSTFGTVHAQTTPSPASQGALLRDGIFGCAASIYANVGTISAIGGVYVPVNDAAVTLNTGYLIYKECVLDGVVAKIAEAAATDLTGTTVRMIATGRGGKPLFPVNIEEELKERRIGVTVALLDDSNVGVMCPDFRNQVRTAVARTVLNDLNRPSVALACTRSQQGSQGAQDFWADLAAFGEPENHPVLAYDLLRNQVSDAQARDEQNQRERWLANDGYYDVTDRAKNPLEEKILTPGHAIAEGAQQVISSGFRRLENADELSEVAGSAYGALLQQITNVGFVAATQPQNGLPSYVSRMVTEAGNAVRQEAVNAALNILLTSRQFEAAYKQAKEDIANILTQAITRLRNAEKACWDLIIPKVQAHAATLGASIKIATSTQFSQVVIDSQISPVAVIVADDIKKSEVALAQLDTLIANVTNSASATNQRQALEQLDVLVANKILHTASEAQAANQQRDSVSASANTLVEDTLRAWGDSQDPSVGWCNVNNPATIERWFTAWRI